ncbi:hypothetical protein [Sphingomonas crusticola]|uniref:hypothetical protein n=1 Tax=Sphingomonas crusticola TaxID=1697973 RepID=UPI0013C2B9CA|nr:hypothetical protein [Sphingomonas crusticola]
MAWRLIALVAAALASANAWADMRKLEVPVTAGWQHARTGLILMPQVAGMSRIEIGDFGTEEADVAASYGNAEHTIGTIYLFHPGLDSVPVWFDRSQTAILTNKRYGSPVGAAEPRPFAIRSGGANDSLRITYALQGGNLTATALALVPVGEWLVAVRLSSGSMSAETLDQTMSGVLRDIRWPAKQPAGPAAVPVAVCGTPLRFSKARMVKPDMAQALINAMLPTVASDTAKKEKAAPPIFCRDRAETKVPWAVYRPDGATDRYFVALNDAGRAISVAPALVIEGPPSYSVTMFDLTMVKTYPNVTAMLDPEQAVAIVGSVAPLSSTSTSGGKTDMTINSDAFSKKP